MQYQNIVFEQEEHLATITINRPESRNSLDFETFSELRDVTHKIDQNNDIRAVIILGAGEKAFASGADIRSLKQRTPQDVLKGNAPETLREIENLNKPMIAAIDGFALGGGCELAMACDIRIATRNSKLGQPEVNLGIIPGAGGTQRLPRIVGVAKAKELIYTGEVIDADEAYRIGLVNRVVYDSEELLNVTREITDKISQKGPVAVSLSKQAINQGVENGQNAGLEFEKHAQSIAFCTKDKNEGIDAFLEKRKPEFKGE